MKDRSIAILSIGKNLSDRLAGTYLIACLHIDLAQIAVNRQIVTVTDNDRIVISRDNEHACHLAIEHGTSIRPRSGLDIETWGEDKNNNGIDDNEETKYTVTYKDGVDGEVFADQVYGNLLSGVATPAFEGTPTREGYVFKGWKPAVAEKVTGDVTYVAVWEKAKDNNGDTKPGDTKPGNTKPGNTKPGNTKPNTTTNSSTKAGTSARSPKTSDTANLALWMALLVVSGGSMVINKKKKYNR